jgi:hypothetical protein
MPQEMGMKKAAAKKKKKEENKRVGSWVAISRRPNFLTQILWFFRTNRFVLPSSSRM